MVGGGGEYATQHGKGVIEGTRGEIRSWRRGGAGGVSALKFIVERKGGDRATCDWIGERLKNSQLYFYGVRSATGGRNSQPFVPRE